MRAVALCFASAALIRLSLSPYDLWWCAWISLVPMLIALNGTSLRQAALYGWLTGTVANYAAFHWITIMIQDFSELGPVAYLIMLIMALYQGIPYLLWAALLRSSRCFSGKPGYLVTAFTAALFLPAIEYFYPIVFPWYLANTQHSQVNLLGVVDLGGPALLSLAITVVNLCVARLLLPTSENQPSERVWPLPVDSRGRLGATLVALVTLSSCWGYSVWRNQQVREAMADAPKLEIGLVQPNHWINQVDPVQALHDYQRLTHDLVIEATAAGRPLDLILWPESAVRTPAPDILTERGFHRDPEPIRFPLDLVSVRPGLTPPAERLELERVGRDELLAIQRGHSVPILFGTTLQDMDPDVRGPVPGRAALYNCGVLLDKDGTVAGIAPKVKLLIFGETIPFSGYFPQVYNFIPLASALKAGTEAITIELEQARLGMMICYEDLLPWFHYELAEKRPQVLLNLTNDAWFGKTLEAEAHLSLSKLRAVEGRVYLVRSTPTGVSAFVDATGAVVGQIDQDETGTLIQSVPLLDIDTVFERFGDSVAWFGLFWVLVYLIAVQVRRKRSDPTAA